MAFTSAIFLWAQQVQNIYFLSLFPFIGSQSIGNTTFNLTNMGKYKPS